MQIKKFIAPALKEAVLQMRAELGDDAIVLSTKVFNADPNLGTKKLFELTASVDEDYNPQGRLPGANEKVINRKNGDYEDEIKKLSDKIYGVSLKQKEVKENKSSPVKTYAKSVESDFKEISELLVQREVDKRIVDRIGNQLNKYGAFLNKENIDNYVVSTISSMINTRNFEYKKNSKPRTIALIGPTGVGKTTCIAKLGVISKIIQNLEIGLISIDTYRLGALDQLKIFSEVSNIDFLVAYEPLDLPKLMNKFKKKDIVFIDTMGRSQNSPTLLKGIKDFLTAVKIDDIYLVLSTTTTSKNMIDVADKFRILKYTGLIFTKLDEAVSFGNILNLVTKFNVPVYYLTNGQIIPDDIIAAEADFIANIIYTGAVNQ